MRKPVILTKLDSGSTKAKQIVLDGLDIRKIVDEGSNRLVYAGPPGKQSTYVVKDTLTDIVNKLG